MLRPWVQQCRNGLGSVLKACKRSMSVAAEEISSEQQLQTIASSSDTHPVVLLFHAPWSPQCNGVQTQLENHLSGSIATFARMNIDVFPVAAQQLRVTTLPAVYCLLQRRIVDYLSENLSESDVREFASRVMALQNQQQQQQQQQQQGEAPETLIDEAKALLEQNERERALPLLMQIVQSSEDIGDSNLGKARALLARAQVTPPGNLDLDEAREHLNVAKNHIGWGNTMPTEVTAVEAMLALVEKAQEDAAASSADNDSDLEERAKSAQEQLESRLQALRSLALRRYVNGQFYEALEACFRILMLGGKQWNEQEGRKLAVQILDAQLNQNAEHVRRGRSRLSSIWFM